MTSPHDAAPTNVIRIACSPGAHIFIGFDPRCQCGEQARSFGIPATPPVSPTEETRRQSRPNHPRATDCPACAWPIGENDECPTCDANPRSTRLKLTERYRRLARKASVYRKQIGEMQSAIQRHVQRSQQFFELARKFDKRCQVVTVSMRNADAEIAELRSRLSTLESQRAEDSERLEWLFAAGDISVMIHEGEERPFQIFVINRGSIDAWRLRSQHGWRTLDEIADEELRRVSDQETPSQPAP